MTSTLAAFAESVGPPGEGAVCCVGGRTQWDVGGAVDPAAREVAAPSGVVAHQPAEMIVRVRAGTTLAELHEATAVGGQRTSLDSERPAEATVGGILACGRSGVRRLGLGPVRDAVLEVTAVSAAGRLVRAGAPLVKNVTGFDLCRLLVGSVGTLAFVGEVVLRCQPVPACEVWWAGADGTDPFTLQRGLFRPLSVLWDGTRTWVGLAGHPADVAAQGAPLRDAGFEEVPGPPRIPTAARRSLPARRLADLPCVVEGGSWLAEVGVGVVHCDEASARYLPEEPPGEAVVRLHRRVKARFDPHSRMNPGRSPLHAVAAGIP